MIKPVSFMGSDNNNYFGKSVGATIVAAGIGAGTGAVIGRYVTPTKSTVETVGVSSLIRSASEDSYSRKLGNLQAREKSLTKKINTLRKQNELEPIKEELNRVNQELAKLSEQNSEEGINKAVGEIKAQKTVYRRYKNQIKARILKLSPVEYKELLKSEGYKKKTLLIESLAQKEIEKDLKVAYQMSLQGLGTNRVRLESIIGGIEKSVDQEEVNKHSALLEQTQKNIENFKTGTKSDYIKNRMENTINTKKAYEGFKKLFEKKIQEVDFKATIINKIKEINTKRGAIIGGFILAGITMFSSLFMPKPIERKY